MVDVQGVLLAIQYHLVSLERTEYVHFCSFLLSGLGLLEIISKLQ